MLWNIPLRCMKMCHCEWFNRNLNCQKLSRSRKYTRDFWGQRKPLEEERWSHESDGEEAEWAIQSKVKQDT